MQIKSAQGDYEVAFGPIVNTQGRPTIIDANVARLYPEMVNYRTMEIHADENSKSFDALTPVFRFLEKHDEPVVAVGGGVIQDIVCFCTALHRRGRLWYYVPTTLLSMADSCIGAKCGINFNGTKNQLGAFHAPKAVYVDVRFLKTLSDRMILSGQGEMLKMHFLGSTGYLEPTEQNIRASLELKQKIIEADEHEKHLRKELNYGHTFGHALEGMYDVPHGIAVAWGMDIENWIAKCFGYWEREDFYNTRDEIVRAGFKIRTAKKPDTAELMRLIAMDKKRTGDLITMWCNGKLIALPWKDFPPMIDDYWKTEGVNELLHWD